MQDRIGLPLLPKAAMGKGRDRTRNMFANISNPFQYLWYKVMGAKGPFTFRAAHGIALEVPRRLLSTFKEMFFRAPYAEGLPKGIDLGPEPLVIDIGGNVGYFSFWILSKYPKATVHAFEPFPPNLRLFERYRSAHPQFKLHLHPKAVAGEAGEFELHYNAEDEFSTSAALADNQEGSVVTVESITLPDFIASQGIERIDWLKVDCEGAEYGIFRNLPSEILARTRIVTLENHDSEQPGETQGDLVRILESHGFHVFTNGYSPLVWAWRE